MPRDAVIGLVVLAFAGLYYLAAGTIRHSSLEDAVGAAGMPNALAALLAGLAILMVLRSLLAPRLTAARATRRQGEEAPRAHLRALGMLGIGILYLAAAPILGYVISVALLLGAVAIYNYRKPTPELALFAVGAAGCFYVLFVWILDIPLPPGIWPALLPL